MGLNLSVTASTQQPIRREEGKPIISADEAMHDWESQLSLLGPQGSNKQMYRLVGIAVFQLSQRKRARDAAGFETVFSLCGQL